MSDSDCEPGSKESEAGALGPETASKEPYLAQQHLAGIVAREAKSPEAKSPEVGATGTRKPKVVFMAPSPTGQRECSPEQKGPEAEASGGTEAASSNPKPPPTCTLRSWKSRRGGGGGGEAVVSQPSSANSSQPSRSEEPVSSAMRSMTRSMTRVLRRNTIRKTTLFWPSKQVPPNSEALFSATIHNLSIPTLGAAMVKTECCPLIRFLREVFFCTDIDTTDWRDSADVAGASIRQNRYTMPVPREIQLAAKLLRVPEFIHGTTVWQLRVNSNELQLVQQSYTKDVLYGDRFKLQNTYLFKDDCIGGVKMSSWTDILWDKPLPWTHGAIKRIIETKAKRDSPSATGKFVQILEEAAV